MMHTIKALILTVGILILAACSSQQVGEHSKPCNPVTSRQFLNHPFYVDLSLDAVRKAYGDRYRLTRFLRQVDHQAHGKDTIYRLHNRHTSLVFYKTNTQEASFLTSKIADGSIELRPCIQVGMQRMRLEQRISDFPSDFRDTVTLENAHRQAIFIFEESKLPLFSSTIFSNKGILPGGQDAFAAFDLVFEAHFDFYIYRQKNVDA